METFKILVKTLLTYSVHFPNQKAVQQYKTLCKIHDFFITAIIITALLFIFAGLGIMENNTDMLLGITLTLTGTLTLVILGKYNHWGYKNTY